MAPANPFAPATPVAKKLKVLLYGPAGSGKTTAALSFPKCAVIDGEGGTHLYAGRPGIQPFSVLHAKTLAQLQQAVGFIEADAAKTFETLVIDPITVFFTVIKEAEASKTRDGSLSYREWARINQQMASFYTRLTNLPVHVVVLARETAEYDETPGASMRRVGVKPDADKGLPYQFDFTIRMLPDHTGIVEKSRGVVLGSGGRLQRVDWSTFEPISQLYVTGEQARVTEDEQAIREQADVWDDVSRRAWSAKWANDGVTEAQQRLALEIKDRWSEWTGGVTKADEKLREWIGKQIAEKSGPVPAAAAGR